MFAEKKAVKFGSELKIFGAILGKHWQTLQMFAKDCPEHSYFKAAFFPFSFANLHEAYTEHLGFIEKSLFYLYFALSYGRKILKICQPFEHLPTFEHFEYVNVRMFAKQYPPASVFFLCTVAGCWIIYFYLNTVLKYRLLHHYGPIKWFRFANSTVEQPINYVR